MKLKSLTRSDVSRLADSSLIYARGEEYYQSGAIYQFSSSATGLTAKLHGNYGDYTVKISEASAGLQTECDCPYDGDVCKHIVAALLRYLESDHDEAAPDKEAAPGALEQALAAMPHQELLGLIMK